ncbi:MAG: hypothetical protein WA432_04295 [Candidatus Babeliaceae bacterium]
MFFKKCLFFILSCLSLCLLNGKASMCQTAQECRDNSCQCYCSRICRPRDKNATDRPVFVKDDPAGHYCYCKPWDLDNFEERCNSEFME